MYAGKAVLVYENNCRQRQKKALENVLLSAFVKAIK